MVTRSGCGSSVTGSTGPSEAIQTSADVGTGGVQITHTPPGTVDVLTPDAVGHRASVDFTVPDTGPFDYAIVIRVVSPEEMICWISAWLALKIDCSSV